MIYVDNAATTRMSEAAVNRMVSLINEEWGNPSSLYEHGQRAKEILEEVREEVAAIIGAEPREIIFTSGGTESDNLAILGVAQARKRTGRHIVTSYLEHPAVLSPVAQLAEQGFDVTYVEPDAQGVLHPEDVAAAVREDTILISVMAVNNEIGSVQPVSKIAAACKQVNPQVLVHSDAVQAFCKIPLFPKRDKIDLMSFSGHKIHGPKGIGALYLSDPRMIRPVLFGGGQQKDMRPGTENVPGIAGFALAASMMTNRMADADLYQRSLKKQLAEGILSIEDTHIHGAADSSQMPDTYAGWGAPSIVSASFRGVSAEVLLHALEERGIYVSSGSACSSNHPKISDVLKAIGAAQDDLSSTIRFSFSDMTTEDDIAETVAALKELVPVLRRFTRK